MKHSAFLSVFLMAATLPSLAGYDKSYYQGTGWSGEYPHSLSVVLPGVVVQGRSKMDLDAPANIACELPYTAVISQWNEARNKTSNIRYATASKIVPMTAFENFVFTNDDGKKINIKKGQTIEYLIYGAEGTFLIRIKGKEMMADQSLFDHLLDPDDEAFRQDEWLKMNCANGKRVWLFYGDLVKVDAEGNVQTPTGIQAGPGAGRIEYGHDRDLTVEEAIEAAAEQP